MSIAEKLVTIAENVPKVYKAGQDSMIDESKIIEKTASGKGTVRVDDVSEVPHEVSIKLTAPPVNLITSGFSLDDMGYYRLQQPLYLESGKTYKFEVITASGHRPAVLITNEIWDYESQPVHVLHGGSGEFIHEEPTGSYYMYVSDFGEIVSASLFEVGAVPDISGTKVTVNGTEYTANADGTVESVRSTSPTMEVSTNSDIDIALTYHKSWGMQAEWDRFWEVVQDGGKTQNYYYAFAYGRFTDENYNPKYPIKFSNGTTPGRYVFYEATGITDTKVEIVANSTNMDYCFYGCSNLVTIPKLTVTATTGFNATFNGCSALENIEIGGAIGKNISSAPCSKLSDASVASIIEHLKDLTGTTSQTLTVHKDIYDRMVGTFQDVLVTAKNWTLVSA